MVGVSRSTFEEMINFITTYKTAQRKHPSRGRPCKLSIADQVLVMVMYYREYRTFFHVGASYGLSERQCWRVVTTTESILLQNDKFHLPGKKALHKSENNFEVIVVDVSKHPIERPKKKAKKLFGQKETAHHKKPIGSRKKKSKNYLCAYRQR